MPPKHSPSRVLLVSLYHPELVRGGAQQACYELFNALRDDCETILLSSIEPQLAPALFKSGAVITGFDGRKNEFLFLSQGYDHGWHTNRQPRCLEKFEEFLSVVRPDVIHFHHFMTYGLEYLKAARNYADRAGARIVFTFHEFISICMARGQMVRMSDKSLCEEASSVRCHQCFPHLSPEHFTMRRMWIKHHLDLVDVFVAPTNFLRDRYIKWGIPAEKIVQIANGHRHSIAKGANGAAQPAGKRNRFAFFGQFVDNKGLLVLFDAIKQLRKDGFDDFAVDVHGDNLKFATDEFKTKFDAFWEQENAAGELSAQVRLHGSYEMADLPRLMDMADWVVVPSTWWEIFGMVVSEGFLFGKPVICSSIGGIGERVRDGVDGLHFAVGSSTALAGVMKRALTEDGLWQRLHDNVAPPPSAESIAKQHIELCYRG